MRRLAWKRLRSTTVSSQSIGAASQSTVPRRFLILNGCGLIPAFSSAFSPGLMFPSEVKDAESQRVLGAEEI
jgi:hypothetical protein